MPSGSSDRLQAQYWPTLKEVPAHAYPYVWHGLDMLRNAGLLPLLISRRLRVFFFISKQEAALAPFRNGFQEAFAGISAAVIERRLVG